MRYKKKPKLKPVEPMVILYDDREKRYWMFLQQYWPMRKQRLKVGDYTIQGLEDQVAIEKKSSLEELLNDLTMKYRPTFVRFLTKLSKVPVKAIVVEDSLSNVAKALEKVRRKSGGRSRLTPETIYYWLAQITIKYKIPVIFTGNDWGTPVRVVRHLFMEAQRQCIS